MPELPVESMSSDQPRVSDAVRVQILATEHWSLLATRSMVWNEIFTRAGMFLTTLSAATVALALVAQATNFDDTFRSLALLVLPVVLFLGIATFIRLGHAQVIDVWTVVGMNRLRHAYLDIAPDLESHFVTSQHDDWRSLLQTSGHFDRVRPSMALSSTPTIVGVISAVLAGVIADLVVATVSDREALQIAAGVAVALVAAVIMLGVAPYRQISQAQREYQPRFPRQSETLAT
jgi:hypothetical protein